jgi:hypothetical protein
VCAGGAVVGDTAALDPSVVVQQCVGCAVVGFHRDADAARADELDSRRGCSLECEVVVAENEAAVDDAVEQFVLVLVGLGCE